MTTRKTTSKAQATAATSQTPTKKGLRATKPVTITVKPLTQKAKADAFAKMDTLTNSQPAVIKVPRNGLLSFLAAGAVFVPMSPACLSSKVLRAAAVKQGATLLTLPADNYTTKSGQPKTATPDRNTIQKTWFGNGLPLGVAYLEQIAPALLKAWNLPALAWVEGTDSSGTRVVQVFATDSRATPPTIGE